MTPLSPPHPVPASEEEETTRASSRARGRRVTAVAFVVSAIVHLLAVALYPLLTGPPPEGAAATSTETRRPQGMEVVRVVEVPPPEEATAEPPVEPAEPAEPAAPEPAAVSDVEPPPAYIGPPDRVARTPAEEIRPRQGDPRLMAPLPDHIASIDAEWLARLRIVWAIEELSDSATAAAAAAAAANDWTYTDGDGKKWGVSPGKIHLGDVTIPFPFSFAAPYNSDAAQRARDDAAIVRQAVEAATREVLRERAKAMRERRERERARANGTPPDTTGAGGGRGGAP